MTAETITLAGTAPAHGTALGTDADDYRGRVAGSLAAGWRYRGTHVAAGGAEVRTLLAAPGGATRLVAVPVRDGAVPSVVDLAPAANWDEREAHDRYGVGFTGHHPLRPLVDHGPLAEWTVPVRGDDVHQVAVGPIHAGVIESGHFRFHLVGDLIVHLDARLFYKHRGLERAAEGAGLDQAGRYLGRACAACSVSNGLAYAHAWERLLGLVATPGLARVRTVLLELERVWNHLNDLAAICAGVGLAAGNHHFAALTERARRLNARLTGHRFLAGSVRTGDSGLVADAEAVRALREELAGLRAAAATGWDQIRFNASFADRLPGVGVVTAERALSLGTVGPAARAAGLAEDARTGAAGLAYHGFAPVVVERPDGDVRARCEQRTLELWQSFDILDGLLDGPLEPAVAEPGADPDAIGIGLVESPRGATSCVVEPGPADPGGRPRPDDRDGLVVGRVRLRTGSYANWPSVATAAAGNLLPDFPLINKSFELCYSCADR